MKKTVGFALLSIVCVVSLITFQTAYAESKTRNGITGITYADNGYARAYTYATIGQYSMTVTARVWGGEPNPLKEEKSKGCQDCTITQVVSVCVSCYFAYETTKHVARIQIGADPVTIYTSWTGCQSSGCWYFHNSGCSSTC